MATWDELGAEQRRILRLLTVVQALRGSQLARLTDSSYRLAMYHLERLAGCGLLHNATTADRSKAWYASPAGLRVLSGVAGQPIAGLKSPRLAEHAAQVAEFLVRSLEERRRNPVLCAVSFEAEIELRPGLRCDALARVGWAEASRPPRPARTPLDGLVWDEGAGRPLAENELVLALEVDRGTMTLVGMARKARLYALYYMERWRWEGTYGAFPLPIVVAEGPARAGAVWLRWKQLLRGGADWAVSCWEWLDGGIMGGRWLNADGSVSSLLELPGQAPWPPEPVQAGRQEQHRDGRKVREDCGPGPADGLNVRHSQS
jgi:hypothetical protein